MAWARRCDEWDLDETSVSEMSQLVFHFSKQKQSWDRVWRATGLCRAEPRADG